MTYIAPTAGAYILAPSASYWGYSMIVIVLHGSTVSASGPQGQKVGHKIKIRGQASTAGQVTLQLKAGNEASRSAARAATSRDTVGADATFPNRSG